jgi:hypothetical protein
LPAAAADASSGPFGPVELHPNIARTTIKAATLKRFNDITAPRA